MTDISPEDHGLISRYLAKRLTDPEELMVETRIITDPVFRSEVELTEALRAGLRELESRGEVSPLLTRQTEWWRRPRFAMVASLASIALGLISFHFYQQQEPQSPFTTTETLRFERTRGGTEEADAMWNRTSKSVRLEMHFDVGADPASSYRVTIRGTTNGAASPVMDSSISTSRDGEVVLTVDGALLEPGDYEIRLESQPASELYSAVAYTLTVTDTR